MTDDEFTFIAKGLKAVYHDKINFDDDDNITIWYDMLKDLDYSAASMAVQRYMLTNKYPPTIADIREQYRNIVGPRQMDGMEAWGLVKKAIRNSGYNEVAEYEALPPIVKRAVGSPGNLHDMAIDENYNEGVTRSNFLRQYQIVCEREQEEACIPKEFRLLEEETMNHLADHLEQEKRNSSQRQRRDC